MTCKRSSKAATLMLIVIKRR